jgi:hypothetical protein
VSALGSAAVDVETTPPQPDEVTRAILEAVAREGREPDPWWRAGIEESLEE